MRKPSAPPKVRSVLPMSMSAPMELCVRDLPSSPPVSCNGWWDADRELKTPLAAHDSSLTRIVFNFLGAYGASPITPATLT